MAVTLCSEALSGCSGCEMSLLNAGDGSLSLLERFDIVHMPILMDHKYFGGAGKREIHIPKARLGLISGGVRNEQQLHIAETMRRQCDLILAFGTCAAYGGIPAMMNLFEDEDLFRRYYRSAEGTDAARNPSQVIPPFLERTFALDEKIAVDFVVTGCPPHPDYITSALESILDGKTPPESRVVSVCDFCPARREGKGAVHRIRRFVKNARYLADKPISEMRCLLDQGFLCMGPVTLGGCGGMNGGPPRCIEARVPCRGCHGPVRKGGSQLMDMLNALVSNGIDTKTVPDRLSTLRFSGAHGRLNRGSARKPE